MEKDKTVSHETGMIKPTDRPPDPTDVPSPGDQLHRPGDKKPGPGRGEGEER